MAYVSYKLAKRLTPANMPSLHRRSGHGAIHLDRGYYLPNRGRENANAWLFRDWL